MPSREEIISKITMYGREAYTNDKLAEFAQARTLTFDEIETICRAFISNSDMRYIKNKASLPIDDDEGDWLMACDGNSAESYETYLRYHPKGRHAAEARDAIKRLSKAEVIDEGDEGDEGDWKLDWVKVARDFIVEESNNKMHTASQQADDIAKKMKEMLANEQISKSDIYKFIADDHNIMGVAHIKSLIAEKIITPKGLNKFSKIKAPFIDKLVLDTGKAPDIFNSPAPLDRIHTDSTEIYFWGIPSSGKSCIIGSVLSCLNQLPNTSIDPKIDCNGFDFLNTIRDCFSSEKVIGLPPGTKTEDFYEMGFDLIDPKGKRHPLTIIDLAGEVVRAIYLKNTSPRNLTDTQKKALKTLDNMLGPTSSKNHKMHFFVVEYGAEDKLYENRTQLAYMLSTIQYLNHLNVFTRNTDAIYLIVTKTDKAPFASDEDKIEKYRDYVNNKLGPFSRAIENVCNDRKNEIGVFERFLFTLGEVCFRRYCIVDHSPAVQLTEEIINTAGISRNWGIINWIFN